ncbi:MAG: sulfite exporter TauE/SafE family protein [Eubacteriales bacterium]|nr:sulfite exporter TauE/SafE family protein [Eubacteriales bacterium]
MRRIPYLGYVLAGAGAGAVTGLFGAGGGMVLIPLLTLCTDLREEELFPASISVILPICVVSLGATALSGALPWREALPYLLGSAAGGLLAGKYGGKIPAVWLHRGLGILILWGGFRYLWP